MRGLVPGEGLEPSRPLGPTVFETVASTIPPSRQGVHKDTSQASGHPGQGGLGQQLVKH